MPMNIDVFSDQFVAAGNEDAKVWTFCWFLVYLIKSKWWQLHSLAQIGLNPSAVEGALSVSALWGNKFKANCVHSSNKLLLTNTCAFTNKHTQWHTIGETPAADLLLVLLLLFQLVLLGFLAVLHIFATKILTVSKLGDLIWIYGAMRNGCWILLLPLQLPWVVLWLLFRTNTIKYWVPHLMCLLLLLSLGWGLCPGPKLHSSSYVRDNNIQML